ncbi:alkaline phosphatase family protein [Glaciecola sp. SC05]|uniref:alkaline phosphatase family protein n=1 Tax=Glaciecola sp. SC05 TaxID=1987355 RepID=UPI003529385A
MSKKQLPAIIAGPMLRHVDSTVVTLWLVSSRAMAITATLIDQEQQLIAINTDKTEHIQFCVGKHCYIHLLRVIPKDKIAGNKRYAYTLDFEYDCELESDQSSSNTLKQLLPQLFNDNDAYIPFYFATTLTNVAHGSCRKAHFAGADALPELDNYILQSVSENNEASMQCPDLLLLTGDQVYIDDVAGPMLHAIHQVVDLLGLNSESFESSVVANSSELFEHEYSYYQREKLFPEVDANEDLTKAFFKGKRKPVFTSANAQNHLIALNEMLALYLLSWSGRLWPYLSLEKNNLPSEYVDQYESEKEKTLQFASGLGKVERVFSRIPTYMIFDDHDVTDDWNLTRGWEEQVYGNAFSKRIIGNALTAYLLCQGIGNPIAYVRPLLDSLKQTLQNDTFVHDKFIEELFAFSHWHYRLDTSPPVQVLDTRTQRWRSESNKNKPSGLMDWEALCELQQNIIGKDSVIMVSAAPVYGVKFIETIQRIFTSFGGALIVDAENWMAHRGTANVMLNIFRHLKTPPNFIILSGDVHYSFVYDVTLRFKGNSPKILQFTCSGMHNQFPDKLLTWFERFNRWLYGHRSPLNWLTKRRNMSVKQRHPEGSERDVVNACSFGLLQLDENGKETACKVICADGRQVVFKPTRP